MTAVHVVLRYKLSAKIVLSTQQYGPWFNTVSVTGRCINALFTTIIHNNSLYL